MHRTEILLIAALLAVPIVPAAAAAPAPAVEAPLVLDALLTEGGSCGGAALEAPEPLQATWACGACSESSCVDKGPGNRCKTAFGIFSTCQNLQSTCGTGGWYCTCGDPT